MSDFQKLMDDYSTIAAYIEDKEAEIASIKKVRDKIKAALQLEMINLNISNAKSTAGHSVCKVTNNSSKVVDAQAFYDFVLETGDTSFLTKHVASDAVAAYLKEHNKLPPGVELVQAITLRFNRA